MLKLVSKYTGKETTEKKNFMWNMVGSTIFSAASMLLSLIVIRIMGADEGGIFAIAITVAQMLAFIEYYETRTFQVTDVRNLFTFGQYKAVKIILLIVSVLVAIVYSMIKGQGTWHKFMVIFLMCIYRYIDGYADLYEGAFQKDGRLDLTGKSQAYRTILSVGVLLISIIVTHNLIVAITISIIFAVLGVLLFDTLPMKEFRNIRPDWNSQAFISIIKCCFPLFLGTFLWSYILSASRIAVDANMASNFSSYFQALFMPVSIINLCATFILKPALTKLSQEYEKLSTDSAFIRSILVITGVIGVFTVICMAGAYLLGIPVLEIMTGTSLVKYKGVLVFLMLAGGINSLSYFGYYILTIMRKTGWIFSGYIIAAIVAKFASDYFVKRSGISGAAMGFFVSVAMLLIIFVIGIFKDIINKRD
ncbi:lipopolysaccharide biosynthesis protein [Agathobacter sp.]